MRSNQLFDFPKWLVTSYGNGLAYTLENKAEGRSVLFQGDDADTFRQELDTLTNGRLPLSYDDALGVLWNDYCVAATQPIAEPVR